MKFVEQQRLPGGAMYATSAEQLAFAQFKADIISGNIYSYIFTKPDGSTLVTLWNIEKEQPFPAKLPADTKILNLYGRNITGKPLVIGPDPVYILVRQGAAEIAKFLKEAIYRNSRRWSVQPCREPSLSAV